MWSQNIVLFPFSLMIPVIKLVLLLSWIDVLMVCLCFAVCFECDSYGAIDHGTPSKLMMAIPTAVM